VLGDARAGLLVGPGDLSNCLRGQGEAGDALGSGVGIAAEARALVSRCARAGDDAGIIAPLECLHCLVALPSVARNHAFQHGWPRNFRGVP
jgi:hypothetical protein